MSDRFDAQDVQRLSAALICRGIADKNLEWLNSPNTGPCSFLRSCHLLELDRAAAAEVYGTFHVSYLVREHATVADAIRQMVTNPARSRELVAALRRVFSPTETTRDTGESYLTIENNKGNKACLRARVRHLSHTAIQKIERRALRRLMAAAIKDNNG